MALTISEDRYQAIRRKVLEQQDGDAVREVLNEGQATERSFDSVESLMAFLDSLHAPPRSV
jgi:hypothetical protein